MTQTLAKEWGRMNVTVKDPVRFLALLHHRVAATARPRGGSRGAQLG